eukprot:678262-Hanusia_phi.AAC.1
MYPGAVIKAKSAMLPDGQLASLPRTQSQPQKNPETFYRRPLPDCCIPLSSKSGKELFRSALATGGCESFFELVWLKRANLPPSLPPLRSPSLPHSLPVARSRVPCPYRSAPPTPTSTHLRPSSLLPFSDLLLTYRRSTSTRSQSPRRVWQGPWRWYHEEMLDCCKRLDVVRKEGVTLGEFCCLAQCKEHEQEVEGTEDVSN